MNESGRDSGMSRDESKSQVPAQAAADTRCGQGVNYPSVLCAIRKRHGKASGANEAAGCAHHAYLMRFRVYEFQQVPSLPNTHRLS